MLVLADLTTVVVLVAFAVTTLVEEPGTAVALVAILLIGVVLDLRGSTAGKRRAQWPREGASDQGRKVSVAESHPAPRSS